MLVEITQNHINNASTTKCPLEVALSELFDRDVFVGYNFWCVRGVDKLYGLPSKARNFAIKFDTAAIDERDKLKPISTEFGDVSLNDQKEILLQGIKIHSLA